MTERAILMAELERAEEGRLHTMGGVDIVACAEWCRLISRLRLALRDDAAMILHLQAVVNQPARVRTRHPAA
mgnify:CR=1 FL=1